MGKKPPKDIWDRVIVFYTAQVENEAYAKRLAAKAAALGSEAELIAEADRMVNHYFGAYPSAEPWEWEHDPGEGARIDSTMRGYHADVIQRLRETDSYAWGLAVVGIVHLWERTLRSSLRAILKPIPPRLASHDFARLFDHVVATGYAVPEALEFSEISRAILIANATKHGDGASADKLRAADPEMFVRFNDEEMLRVERADFDRAVRAIDKFWSAYEDAYSNWRDLNSASAITESFDVEQQKKQEISSSL